MSHTTAAAAAEFTALERVSEKPSGSHRLGRCLSCDAGSCWKGAAAGTVACVRCGGPLTTSTRQYRAGFALLTPELTVLGQRLPNGLPLTITAYRNRAEQSRARAVRELELLESGELTRWTDTGGREWISRTADRDRGYGGGSQEGHYARDAADQEAKAAKLERKLHKLGGAL